MFKPSSVPNKSASENSDLTSRKVHLTQQRIVFINKSVFSAECVLAPSVLPNRFVLRFVQYRPRNTVPRLVNTDRRTILDFGLSPHLDQHRPVAVTGDMLLRLFTLGARLLAAYLTAIGFLRLVSTMATTSFQRLRRYSTMMHHVARTLFGVLVIPLWHAVSVINGFVLSEVDKLILILLAVYLTATGLFRLARDIISVCVHEWPMCFGVLLLFFVLSLLSWEFTVMASVMATYLMVKGTFRLRRDGESSQVLIRIFGVFLLLFGLTLHFTTEGIQRGVDLFAKEEVSAQISWSGVEYHMRLYLKQWKEHLQKYKP